MAKIGVFFGTTTGNTEGVAGQLQELLGDEVDLHNVDTAGVALLENYDVLIFGTSTWGSGDLQDDMENFVDALEEKHVAGKPVAIFALGDSASYGDTFVDSISKVYEAVEPLGAVVLGQVDPEGYTFDSSESVVEGKFLGLPIDEENEDELTTERLENWVEQLKAELLENAA